MALSIISSVVLAQQMGSLNGSITDEQGEPLPGINIRLKDQPKGAFTDRQGKFTIKDISPATYTVEISGIGWEKQEFELTIRAGENIQRSFTLRESTTQMDEVVIETESEVQTLRLSAQAVQVIETQQVKLKAADLGEVMARTEGVNVQRAGGLGSNTRFSLNGLSGDQVRFFYDGIPLNYTPYSFGIANVPVNMIDRVEIYKGVVPIQFGADALGGAVNLVPPEIYDGLAGSASYQFGSFNTHRVTANINYANDKTGLFIVAGGFYDYSDNDYKIDAKVDERNADGTITGRAIPVEARRFHDAYRAYGSNLKIGIRSRKWANELSLEGYLGNYHKEVQNSQLPGLIDLPQLGFDNIVFGNPFGEVIFTTFSEGLNFHYNVNPGSRWELDLKAGYNYNERASIDTTRNLYNWLGEVIRVNNEPGEFGEADHLITISESAFARQQLTYIISDQHSIKLSIAPTYSYRTGDDLLVEGEFDDALDERYLRDVVSGLEYTAELLDKRLQNIAFVKNYRQNIRIESIAQGLEGIQIDERKVSNFGAGNGLRYNWSSRFSTKLSYEFAYRLPRQNEIFGDGQLISENLELRPESSHNVNLQWGYGNKEKSATEWQLQGNFFLRKINDLIFLLLDANDEFGSFQNVWSATSQGLELSGRWKDLMDGLTVSANSTYQRYLNTSPTGPFESFRGDRLPNTPYFFVNAAAEYNLRDVLKKNDDLSFFWNARFVQSFFIGWESSGLRQTKLEVPNQTIHVAGLTHRMNIRKIQNALTLEVQNLTNAKVFDFFGVQRPGRAFYIKSTIQF
ncbi:MAG: carboxypeptidase-like regulatory domain-containing protein [Cyclobacteriaceae bacterium]